MPSFFKKPSWAIDQTGEANAEFYRRSGQTYKDIVAANRELHQKPNAACADSNVDDDGRPPKRLRLSDENEKEGNRDIIVSSTTLHGTYSDEHGSADHRELSAAPSDYSTEKLGSNEHLGSNEQLGSDEQLGAQRVEPLDLPGGDHQSAEDNLNANDLPNSPSLTPPCSGVATPRIGSGSDVSESPRDSGQGRVAAPIASQPSRPSNLPADDPVVQILITSEIAKTKPLLVHRKMSQRLGDVRLAWCQRQNFSNETQSSVYLTWKGRRLFDVTTCRSLGISTASNSAALLGTEDDDQFTSPSELRIHMEAVADGPLAASRQNSTPESPESSPTSLAFKAEEQDHPIKLILRSPGRDDFRIKTRLKTLVSRLISAFRERQNIPAEQDVILLFDGDRLDPDTCLCDHDIADQDMVDVQIRNRT